MNDFLSNPYGNPYLQTQANVSANNFTDPLNSSDLAMRSGGWGMDPNLLTPAYTSSYRPSWNGQGQMADMRNRGFFGSINHMMPYNTDYMRASNPTDAWNNDINNIIDTPASYAAFVAQRIAAPIAAFGIAGKMIGPRKGSWMGMAGNASNRGFAANIGHRFGTGMGTSIGRGFGMSATSAAMMGRLGGGAMGLAAGIAAPIALGTAMLTGAERAFFNPFINNVKSAEDLHQNFAGSTFGDAQGKFDTGRGLGYAESARMASGITKHGIRDMSFSTEEYRDLASMSMRSGLLDSSKAQDIVKNIKSISEQVKLVMTVAKDPSVQNAIESLSKLTMAGAGFKDNLAGKTYAQLGMQASVAGTSVQKLMDTVGAQGEYLYRQNSMTPYLGQLAAASSYAGFASANRMGLISSQQLAKMGGLDGATQNSLTAQINATQTPLYQMALYNQNFGGGKGGINAGMANTITSFGANMAANPMQNYGRMQMFGKDMAANAIEKRGAGVIQDILQSAADSGGYPYLKDKDGRINAEAAVPVLLSMGLSIDEIRSSFAELSSGQNKDVYTQKERALNAQMTDSTKALIDRENLYNGVLGKPYRAALNLGRDVTSLTSRYMVDPITEGMGSLKDSLGVVGDALWMGSSTDSAISGDSDLMKDMIYGSGNKEFSKGVSLLKNNKGIGFLGALGKLYQGTPGEAIDSLNKAAKSDPKVMEALAEMKKNPGSKSAKEKLVKALGSISKTDTELGKSIMDHPGGFEGVADAIMKDAEFDTGNTIKGTGSLSKTLLDATGGMVKDSEGLGPMVSELRVMGMATNLAASMGDSAITNIASGNVTADQQKVLDQISQSTGITDRKALAEYIDKTGRKTLHGWQNMATTAMSIDPNDPTKGMSKEMAARFNAAKGDKNAQDKILSEFISSQSGGKVADLAASEDKDVSWGVLGEQFRQSEEARKAHLKNDEMYRSGRINFDTYNQNAAAMDFRDSTKLFSDAVDLFAKSVDPDGEKGIFKNNKSASSGTDTQRTVGKKW